MKLPRFNLRDLFWLVLVGSLFSIVCWQTNVVLERRAMLQVLTDSGCYWKVAEARDVVARPWTVVPIVRSAFGDTPVGCIFVDRCPLENRYREIHRVFPEAMMPIE